MKRFFIIILSASFALGCCYAQYKTNSISSNEITSQQTVSKEQNELKEDHIYANPEQPPKFPGGEAALLQYIASHIRYPAAARANNIEGRVVVQFVITKTGKVKDITVVRPKDPDLDAEAVRVIKSLPNFIPGKMNGKAISCKYVIPVNFSLSDEPTQVAVPVSDDDNVYTAVEQPPTFPGGEAALLQYIASHIRYPAAARANNIEGRVVVQFVITKTGRVGEAKVVRPKDPDLDAEAVRVIKSLPNFIPGRISGKAVNVWYTLPVNFRLGEE